MMDSSRSMDAQSHESTVPYWRLSSFYFFYFALLGCISPYWGLFLDARGFDAQAIGELMALFGLVRILAPNVWGALGDYTGRRMALLRLGCLMCALIFVNIFWVSEFWLMALIMVGYGFFWAAVLPQFEVVTLNYLRDRTDDYSKIRIWGSIGFVAFVVLLGILFDYLSVLTLPVFMLILLGAIFVSSLTIQGSELAHDNDAGAGFLNLVMRPHVIAFLVAAFLMQVSHGAYYTFFSLFLAEVGYSKSMIGLLWAVGVLAEVVVFMVAHRIFAQVSYRHVLILSLILAAIRWSATAYLAGHLAVLLVLQLLHAATFGTMHAVSMHYIHRYFQGRHQGQGQALFSSLTYGAGGAVGAILSGYLWGIDQGVTMLVASGLSAFIGALVAWRWVIR